MKKMRLFTLFLAVIVCGALFAACADTPASPVSDNTTDAAVTDAPAEETPVSDFEYEESEGGITITGYKGSSADVVIPANISGKPVTSIGNSAFFGKSVQAVTLPKTVTVIEKDAFSGCDKLSAVVLPDGIETISDRAFADCIALDNVELPASLKFIGVRAFYNCSSLKNITLPGTAVSIKSGEAFACSGLESVVIGNGTKILPSGIFYKTNLKEVVLPESVEEISTAAFSECKYLETVTLNDGLITIDDYAFNKSLIKELVIPKSVKTVTAWAFIECDKLKTITFLGDSPKDFITDDFRNNMGIDTVKYSVYHTDSAVGFQDEQWTGVNVKLIER